MFHSGLAASTVRQAVVKRSIVDKETVKYAFWKIAQDKE